MGWSNGATEAVSELMQENSALKREVEAMISNNRHYRRVQDASWKEFMRAVAEDLEPMVADWVGRQDGGPLHGLANAALDSVNWEELATAWIE